MFLKKTSLMSETQALRSACHITARPTIVSGDNVKLQREELTGSFCISRREKNKRKTEVFLYKELSQCIVNLSGHVVDLSVEF